MRKVRKTMNVVITVALVIIMATMPAFADTFSYTPITGPDAGANDGFSFEKDLVMDPDANIPDATFSYSVAPGTAVPAGTGTAKVLAGVGTPTIADVVYEAGEAASADLTITTENGEKIATKVAQVDFSNCTFTEPGIYRYIVTESGNNQGVTNDPIPTRTLDVYVENVAGSEGTPAVAATEWYVDGDTANPFASEADALAAAEDDASRVTNNGQAAVPGQAAGLAVTHFVFYEGTKEDGPSTTATEASGKSEGYRNVYDTYDLEFGKEVKGNFGSLDQYFEFTVVLGNMPEGTILDVDLSDADATPHASDANEVTTAANPTQLEVGADGTVTQVFYIHDGQYIVIKGLPVDATYSVTENAHDYTSSEGIAAADNDEGVAHTDPVSGTIGRGELTGYVNANDDTDTITAEAYEALSNDEKANYEAVYADGGDVKTGYTNTKDVVTPAGIANALTAFAPGIAFIAVAGAVIILMSRKKRENE